MRHWEKLASQYRLAKASGTAGREQLESWGKSGHDYGSLTVKGYLGDLFQGMEELLGGSWAPQVGLKVTSDQKTEFHRWLGPPPMLREWIGDRQAKGMPIYEQVVTNRVFEATLDIAVEDYKFDKRSMLSMRFGELGARTSQHWELLASEHLELNTTAYDGATLFSGAHTLGGVSPTMDNDLDSGDVASLNIATPNAPTPTEFISALIDCAQKFYGFRDAFNVPINGGLRNVLVMVPTNLLPAALAAIRVERLASGASNPIKVQDIQFQVVCNPFLGNTINSSMVTNPDRTFYIFRADTRVKPLILQEAAAPEVEFQGPGSHTAFTQNKYLLGIKAARAVGNGEWSHALRCTFS